MSVWAVIEKEMWRNSVQLAANHWAQQWQDINDCPPCYSTPLALLSLSVSLPRRKEIFCWLAPAADARHCLPGVLRLVQSPCPCHRGRPIMHRAERSHDRMEGQGGVSWVRRRAVAEAGWGTPPPPRPSTGHAFSRLGAHRRHEWWRGLAKRWTFR